MIPEKTTVLVIGGGPNGLVASGLLSQLGISNVLVERRNGTQPAPAAHVIRHRPLQVLAQLGLGDRIRETIPSMALDYVNWCTTIGGSEIGRLDLRRGRGDAKDSFEETWINLSQSLLEPLLVEAASRQPESEVRFGVECIEINQTPDTVKARVRTQEGTEHEIEASWAIAADGAGSRTRAALGIDMEGIGPLGEFYMVHFNADLRPWTEGRSGPLFWIMNPESVGTVIVHDPRKSYVFMTPARGIDDEEATIPGRLAEALGVPIDVDIVSMATWVPFNQVAERYREGRVFLAGDAAHRFPPTGGLGLNTGILDVHNLVWKLAMVERGQAGDALLDSYEEECRPAARANADVSFQNMLDLGKVNDAIGTFETLEGLEERLVSMTGEEKRLLDEAIDSQFDHFASEGEYPDPIRGDGELEIMRWPAPYAGFTLFAMEEGVGSELAKTLSVRLDVPVGFRCLTAEDREKLPTDATAFLTRPDGIIEWANCDLAGFDAAADAVAVLERLLRRSAVRESRARFE